MTGDDEDEVIFTKKAPSSASTTATSPSSSTSNTNSSSSANGSTKSSTRPSTSSRPASSIETPRHDTVPALQQTGSSSTSTTKSSTTSSTSSSSSANSSKRRTSTLSKSQLPAPPQLLDIKVSCRNLSANSSVVALFEAKGNKSLEYVGHTEGIRHSHHPDFQTHLFIEHRKGTSQKVKFNVYILPPGNTRVEEKMRIGSAYVYLDEIAANLGLDLLIDLVHGYDTNKDKNNQWLQSHLLIKARVKEDQPEEERLAKVRSTALSTMTEGRRMVLYDINHQHVPTEYLFFYRPDSELGALYWLDLRDCPGGRAPTNFKPIEGQSERIIRLMDILAIYEGHQTQAFKHPSVSTSSSSSPDRCFSIIVADGSIDLECATVEDREAFMLGVHDILTTQAEKERSLDNTYKFLVKCRNLPPEIREGGLFVALSSRDTKGLQYEVVNKTGWLASSATPDFPKAMTVPYISETQSLKFDLFHNSLNASDGVGTAIVVYKELKGHIGKMLMIPLRNMIDPDMDALLQKYKSVMLVECLEFGGDDDDEDEDEIAEDGDSDEESEEYYGEKLKKLRAKNRDLLDSSGYQGFELPVMPPPPAAVKVSIALFNGYMLDKYAFNTKGCQRKMIFAGKDVDPNLESSPMSPPPPPALSPSASSAPLSFPSSSASPSTTPTVIIPGNEHGERSPDRMRLYWCKPGKPVKSLQSSLKLSDVTNVLLGKKTATLQRKDAAKAPDDCCVSLAFHERTLDLVADTPDVRDAFVADIVHFLLPRSQEFDAWGHCGTGVDPNYERMLVAYNEAMAKAERDVRARLAAMGANNPYAELAGNGEGVNQTAMPDLQAAMTLLAKLHDKGMERLGLNPNEEFNPSRKARSHPDIMSSLAALDDIFSELDARFNTGGKGIGGGGNGTGGGTGDGVGPGIGGGNPLGGGGSGTGGGTGDGIGPGIGGGGGRGKGRGGKGTGGGRGDGHGSGSESEGEGTGGGGKKKEEKDSRDSAKSKDADSDKEGSEDPARAKKPTDGVKSGDDSSDSGADDSEDEKTMDEIAKKLAGAKTDDAIVAPAPGAGVPVAPPMAPMMVVAPGAPPPPPMGPSSFFNPAKPAPRKLKQLHWDPLQSDVTHTIFNNLDKGELEDEEGEIEELFANHIAKKKIEPSGGKASKGVTLIESKRAYNVEIGISRVKMTTDEIKTALFNLDPDVLNDEKSQILLDRVPTLEELAILKKYTGPLDELGSVEKFFLMMSTIPMCALRLECHIFRLHFPESSNDLKTKLKVMFNSCKALTTSNNLARVYQLVLQVGNYLNAGTRKGNASGFKIGSLPALSNTKSTDGKLTLLDYIVARVDKQFKTDEDRVAKVPFLADIHILKDAVNYDWQAVQDEHRRMKVQLKKIQTVVTGPPMEDSKDQFQTVMTTFYNSANEEFKLLTKRLKRIMQLEEQLLAYFGETKDKTDLSQLFSLLSSFTSAFEFSEMNLKPLRRDGGAKKKPKELLEGGVADPRLGGNFAGMLQSVKLKSKSGTGARHLASGYAGRKQQDGTTIQPMDQDHVGANAISIDFGGASDQGETIVARQQYAPTPEFVVGAGAPPPPPIQSTLS